MDKKWKKLFAFAVAIARDKDYISDYLFYDMDIEWPRDEDGDLEYEAIWTEYSKQFEAFFGMTESAAFGYEE